MKRIAIVLVGLAVLASCKNKSSDGTKKFQVSGTITNNPAKVIYLEEIPMTTMQRNVVDSALLDKEGKYKLNAASEEARVYNLRLDNSTYPIAAIINDAADITVNANFSKENSQFVDNYELKGSKASAAMKDFMTGFNNKLQSMFMDSRRADSLSKEKGVDSLLAGLQKQIMATSFESKLLAEDAIKKSDNPALTMFILGYYQSTANNQGMGLQPMEKNEVKKIINDATAKFPEHKSLASIKASVDAADEGMVGKAAPEISLPDPGGKEIKLSSLRGKYVLVDFWASWCRPCREENPNVVKAYNRFKDKNFTILGVSLDRPGTKDAWTKAIMNDHLTWNHVSDLMYWNSVVVKDYKFEGIPYNVLVDPTGKIIAENLRGDALEEKLGEVLN